MRLKPKTTNLNPRALLYKRFTDIEQSFTLNAVYKTSDNKYWLFDKADKDFKELTVLEPTTVILVNALSCLSYKELDNVYYFAYVSGKWENVTNTANLQLLSAEYANIGKYQTNKYYYAGSFDYIKKGAIEGSTTQYLKGNIMPLDTMSIQHFNDYIHISIDDLVVINNRVYMVQNPVEDHKHQPRDYTIYSLDLISVL